MNWIQIRCSQVSYFSSPLKDPIEVYYMSASELRTCARAYAYGLARFPKFRASPHCAQNRGEKVVARAQLRPAASL